MRHSGQRQAAGQAAAGAGGDDAVWRAAVVLRIIVRTLNALAVFGLASALKIPGWACFPTRPQLGVFFEHGGDKLTANSDEQLKKFLRRYDVRCPWSAHIYGHVGPAEGVANPDESSQRRARATRDALFAQGFNTIGTTAEGGVARRR